MMKKQSIRPAPFPLLQCIDVSPIFWDRVIESYGRGGATKRHLLLTVGLMVAAGSVIGARAQESAGGARREGPAAESMSAEERQRWEKMIPGTPAQKQEAISQIQKRHQIDDSIKNDPSSVGRLLTQYLQEMRDNAKNEGRFLMAATSFRHVVETAESANIQVPIADANRAAALFIAKLQSHANEGFMNKSFFFRFIAAHASSDQARNFIKDRLRIKGSLDREQTLQGLYFSTSFKGDADMSDTLLAMYTASQPRDFQLLAIVARIDPDKTLPILNAEAPVAKRGKAFNSLASVASMTRKPAALDPIIARALELPPAPAGSDNSPTLGIYSEPLLAYIQQAEDIKLERALSVLAMTGGARAQSRDIVVAKLNSLSPHSRKAAYSYLGQMFKAGDFANKETLMELRSRAESEHDPETKQAARRALDILEKRVKK